MKTSNRGESLLSATPCLLFIIRGVINGSMCYVSKDSDKYVAKPSTVGVHASTLFEHRQDAKNALDEMRHGTAVLMEIVELSPANDQVEARRE